ncbi:MAG: glycosyltransferase family 39 protein [Armatimonadota bacterium]
MCGNGGRPISRRAILVVFALATGLRLGYDWAAGRFTADLMLDEHHYHAFALSLAAGEGYRFEGKPSAFRPPVYPLFLAATYLVVGERPGVVRGLQGLISAATCVGLIFVAREAGFSARTSLMAGVFGALHPLLWVLAGMLWSETLYLGLLTAVVWLWLRADRETTLKRLVALGVLSGTGIFLRPEMCLYVATLTMWALLARAVKRVRPSTRMAALLGPSLALIAIWTVRNYYVLHAFVPLTTQGGVVLWNGNNPLARGGATDPLPENWRGEGPPPDLFFRGWSDLSEVESARRFRREAQRWILGHPGQWAAVMLMKAARIFRPDARANLRESGVPLILSALYYVFLGLVVVGVCVHWHRRRTLLPVLAPVAVTVTTSLVFYASTRISAPLAIPVCIFGAAGAAFTFDRFFRREPPAALTRRGHRTEV